jgi:hypothetical protein
MNADHVRPLIIGLIIVGIVVANRESHSSNTDTRASSESISRLAPAPAIPYTPPYAPSFHGYECTQDCGGHEAGYQWAEDNGVDDEDDCGGNSESFIEGCKAYVEENAKEFDEDDGSDDDGGSPFLGP